MSDKKKATKNNKSNQDQEKLSNLSKSIKKIIKEDIHTTSNKFTQKNKFKKTNDRSTTHLNNIPDVGPQDKEAVFQKAKNLYEQVYYFSFF